MPPDTADYRPLWKHPTGLQSGDPCVEFFPWLNAGVLFLAINTAALPQCNLFAPGASRKKKKKEPLFNFLSDSNGPIRQLTMQCSWTCEIFLCALQVRRQSALPGINLQRHTDKSLSRAVIFYFERDCYSWSNNVFFLFPSNWFCHVFWYSTHTQLTLTHKETPFSAEDKYALAD